MTDLNDLVEIEALKQMMAKYAHFGDTQNWEEFRKLFTEDMVYSVDAMPRASRDAPQSAVVEGRDTFIAGMGELLKGVQTAHNMNLPEITITGPDTATRICAVDNLLQSQH